MSNINLTKDQKANALALLAELDTLVSKHTKDYQACLDSFATRCESILAPLEARLIKYKKEVRA